MGKDGRPRTVALVCSAHEAPLDDYAYTHRNGGRIPTRFAVKDFDNFDPREPNCQHRECYP